MKKNALTVTVGVLLILYSLLNFGAGMGELTKAKMVRGTCSVASSLGELAGDRAGAAKLRRDGFSTSGVLYLIALFILATAVLDLVAGIGLFAGKDWAFTLLVLAAACGILVEMQDIAEDGFGIGKAIFFGINILALITAFSARETGLEPTR